MKDTDQIIDRDVKGGEAHLTGFFEVRDEEPKIVIYLDGNEIELARHTSQLPSAYESQLPDKFSHIVGDVPLTADENDRYETLVEEYEQERYETALKQAETHSDTTIKVEKRAGIGLHIVEADVPSELRDLLDEELSEDDVDLEAGWERLSGETTVAEILADDEEEGRDSRSGSYYDPRHEANCGARYSKSAACECAAEVA